MGAGAEGTNGGILASGFDMTKPPTGIAPLGGGRRVGSLNDKIASEDSNLGEVGQSPPVIGRHLPQDRKSILCRGGGNLGRG